jgi:PIN domain nuclease of toxin-antitoxin system
MNNLDIITNYHLSLHHRDPFDRFLIWEAIRNDFILITVDGSINEYKNVLRLHAILKRRKICRLSE